MVERRSPVFFVSAVSANGRVRSIPYCLPCILYRQDVPVLERVDGGVVERGGQKITHGGIGVPAVTTMLQQQ